MGELTLEEAREGICPMCLSNPTVDDHEVQFKRNNAGNPMFFCESLNATVNMREGTTDPFDFIVPYVEMEQPDPNGAEEQGEPKTLADLLEDDG